MNFDTQIYAEKAIEMVMSYGPKILLAIVTLFVGSWVIGILGKIFDSGLSKIKFDDTLQPYLVGIATILGKVILYISIVGMLGVQTTSLIAVLGAAGLAIGMALQGSLGNFAGGVLILIFKPIKKGDLIETNGVIGVVESIQPFVTVLLSPDNIVYYIPNGEISSSPIKNYSINQERRVDLTFGISYTDDIDKAKEVFTNVAKACPNALTNIGPDVFVSELADSSVNFAVRPYCKPVHYWDVYIYMLENVKKELDKAGISIPFPQRDVHLHGQK
ncbi:MAG: mechanosensitive ion channel [Halobacteriovoraceae bacterium]|jgi:small conductance mechanosensitive channel|nr:mechanosensitive ion channel [Halobacteriovoraceae bacterium]